MDLAAARALVDEYEPRMWMTAQHGESWSFQINAGAIRRYRGIKDGGDYLRVRTAKPTRARRLRFRAAKR